MPTARCNEWPFPLVGGKGRGLTGGYLKDVSSGLRRSEGFSDTWVRSVSDRPKLPWPFHEAGSPGWEAPVLGSSLSDGAAMEVDRTYVREDFTVGAQESGFVDVIAEPSLPRVPPWKCPPRRP